ncbi:hypothetical protein LEP1GSC041_3884 [Leptospira noguchii str. 2006001870]|uniref:Uncharacterized protein n=2 Tax=Leptospira noguchii TaxID=28182 RepID=M6U8Y8_9LEPT|nr:hypothetical protein LEP1GSC041_3884 [Leptospira noguchii str. 2006001870]EMN01729.1 hypothetical protein LEP1GSC035_3893 [Leptospira noguchii str. 2007001578]EMO41477.1 hypothetical protein LEP1GSC186_1987 [Leptospira noguchii serovar Autumnalis str. ZUN142]
MQNSEKNLNRNDNKIDRNFHFERNNLEESILKKSERKESPT